MTRGRHDEETELIYRYEEDVFDPDDPAALNLASMIAAQVALNYGLFCREIVFHGPFDRHDRRLLLEMAENTAREIYVKKFLEPNPFLIGGRADISSRRSATATSSAELVFPDAEPAADPCRGGPTDRGRMRILSSGGKDSLLELRSASRARRRDPPDLRQRVGPALVHRAQRLPPLSTEQCRTPARVWTNSDRVFSWMLRHLPFIRPDFARRALRRVPDPAVDRGGLSLRRAAAAPQARDRPAGHRRRVRHHPARISHRGSRTTTGSTTRAATSTTR